MRISCVSRAAIRQVSVHFTAAFEAMSLMLMKEMPVKKVGEITREHDSRLWRIMAAHVAVAYRACPFKVAKSPQYMRIMLIYNGLRRSNPEIFATI